MRRPSIVRSTASFSAPTPASTIAIGWAWRADTPSPVSASTRALRAVTSISTFAGVYGGASLDALQLRGGALYAYNRYGTDRSVVFSGFDDAENAGYGGDTLQAFGEAGWRIGLSGFSATDVDRAFRRRDGDAHRHRKFQRGGRRGGVERRLAAGYDYAATTLGARAEAALFDDAPLFARGMLGWRHVFGDVTPTSTLAFASAPSIPFAVAGAPIARDALAVEAGVRMAR